MANSIEAAYFYAAPDGWEDLYIWSNAFAKRGWKRFFTSPSSPQPHMPHMSLSQGVKATIPKYEPAERRVFHNKRVFFSELNTAVNVREGRNPEEPPKGPLVGGKTLRIPFTFTTWEEFEAWWRSDGPQEQELWFYKQEEKSRGSGVFPFICHEEPKPPTPFTSSPPPPGVFQQAVPRFLRTTEGKKFDLRVIVWFGPGRRAYMCRKVFARVAGESLGGEPGGIGEDLRFERHLTNLSVGGDCVLVEDLEKIVEEQHVAVVSSLIPSLSLAVGDLLRLLPHSWLPDGKGFYFGFDFMVDEDGLIWLLEANSRPRLKNCNKLGGVVEEALVDLLEGAIEPSLEAKEEGEMQFWERVL